MLNIENFAYEEETQNKTAAAESDGDGDVTAGQDEKFFFYLSIGLGILSGLLLIVLVVSVLFHRWEFLNRQTCPNSDSTCFFQHVKKI